MSRAQLTSTVEQNTGGAVAPFVAGKNKIINGDFGIWQRGTSFTNPSINAFVSDRWRWNGDGSGGTRIWSQQSFTPGTAPVAGYEGQYFMRYNQSVATSGTTYENFLIQPIENARTFAGQTVTLSFWAKADTAGRTIGLAALQYCGTGGSGTFAVYPSGPTLTTSWVRYTATFTVPSLSGKTVTSDSILQIIFSVGSLNTVQTLDIWGVQLEAGSVATPFTTASNTLQGELALCQRYYYRQSPATGGGAYRTFGNGSALSSTVVYASIQMPVPLRAYPSTSVEYGGTIMVYDGVTGTNVTGLSMVTAYTTPNIIVIQAVVSSGATQYRPYWLAANNDLYTAYLGFSAEL
jgi:hypothetical protein